MLHGLYWLCVGLAELGRPLVLIADDAHWVDGPSLRFLAYPIALVIGTRPPNPGPDGDLLLRLFAQQDVRHLRLQPLSDHGVAELMRTSLDEAPADSFCAPSAGLAPSLCWEAKPTCAFSELGRAVNLVVKG